MNRRRFIGSILGILGVTVTSKYLPAVPELPILIQKWGSVDFEFTEAELGTALDRMDYLMRLQA